MFIFTYSENNFEQDLTWRF